MFLGCKKTIETGFNSDFSTSKEIFYTLRTKSPNFIPKVFDATHTYTLNIGLSTDNFLKTLKKISPEKESNVIQIDLNK